MYKLWLRPTAVAFKRYGSFKRGIILQETAKTVCEAGASWKGRFLDNKAAE